MSKCVCSPFLLLKSQGIITLSPPQGLPRRVQSALCWETAREKTCPPAQDSCWLSQLQLGGGWAGRGRGWVGRRDKVGGQRLEESGLDQPLWSYLVAQLAQGCWDGREVGIGGWSQHHLKPQTDLWGLLQRGGRGPGGLWGGL